MLRSFAGGAVGLCCVFTLHTAHVQSENVGLIGGSGGDGAVEIGQLLAQIEMDGARETQLEQELEQLSSQQHSVHAGLTGRVHALYRMTRSGMAPVIGGFAAVRTHVERVRRLRLLVESDARTWTTLQTRTSAARSETELMRASLTHSRERLSALQAQQAMVVEEPALQAEPAPTRDVEPSFYGVRFSNETPRSSFDSLRGKLAAPVTGDVRVADLQRSAADGPALLFEAAAGTPVRAVAAGRVVFGQNHMVVIDHGGGYATAYGRLSDIDVSVGDEVSAYARIGAIGDDGDDGEPAGLQFELRRGARSVPPRAWLGL
ncbi:MAG: hypothetical protein RL701_3383 [Pseudomonadota bacterium]